MKIKLVFGDAMPIKLGLSSEWIAARFRDERARLDLTHAAVAEAADVSRNAVMAWEKRTSIPADALAKLLLIGFDPQYVVTGVRSQNLEALHDAERGAEPVVTKEEWAMLRSYRSLSDIQRDQARAMLQVLGLGMPISAIGEQKNVIASGAGSIAAGRGVHYHDALKRPKKK